MKAPSLAQCLGDIGRLPGKVEIAPPEMPVSGKRTIKAAFAGSRRTCPQGEAVCDRERTKVERAG